MPKKVKELEAVEIRALTSTSGRYAVGGVTGLLLDVQPGGSASWILRTVVGAKRRSIGLGGYPDVTLADARKRARAAKESISKGLDPVEQRRAARAERIAAQARMKTFDQCASALIEAKSPGWRNAKHSAQWTSTLTTYASPVIGRKAVADITTADVTAILGDLWTAKPETASRLRGRVEAVLDYATAHGYRTGPNPARWRGHLDKLLAKVSKRQRVKHFRALPILDAPAFAQALRTVEGMGARCLELALLTAARSGEARGALWSEFDLDSATWTIPAERMKAGKLHRVPLNQRALDLLCVLPRIDGSDILFPGHRDELLSDMTLTAVLKRMGVHEATTVHGLRSTFRDWCGERTNFPREVAEQALAHGVDNEAEAAYARSDLYVKRVRLMREWGRFLETTPASVTTTTRASKKTA